MERLKLALLHIACALVFAMASHVVHAADTGFYAGKRLTYIVATKPGGGYDQYARLIARHLPRHLGVKSVIVRNVPGASHLIGLQQLFAASADGLTIGTFNTGLLVGMDGAVQDYDLNQLSWVGKAAVEPRVFIVPARSELSSFDDLRRREMPLLIATAGKLSTSTVGMEMIAAAFGIATRHVHGFSGPDTGLAILRGDVQGALVSLSSALPLTLDERARAVFVVGQAQAFPSVETLSQVARSNREHRVAERLLTLSELGRLTAGPPEIPVERLQALREAYMATLTDPALEQEAAQMRLPIDPWGGQRVAAALAEILEAH